MSNGQAISLSEYKINRRQNCESDHTCSSSCWSCCFCRPLPCWQRLLLGHPHKADTLTWQSLRGPWGCPSSIAPAAARLPWSGPLPSPAWRRASWSCPGGWPSWTPLEGAWPQGWSLASPRSRRTGSVSSAAVVVVPNEDENWLWAQPGKTPAWREKIQKCVLELPWSVRSRNIPDLPLNWFRIITQEINPTSESNESYLEVY